MLKVNMFSLKNNPVEFRWISRVDKYGVRCFETQLYIEVRPDIQHTIYPHTATSHAS